MNIHHQVILCSQTHHIVQPGSPAMTYTAQILTSLPQYPICATAGTIRTSAFKACWLTYNQIPTPFFFPYATTFGMFSLTPPSWHPHHVVQGIYHCQSKACTGCGVPQKSMVFKAWSVVSRTVSRMIFRLNQSVFLISQGGFKFSII